MTAILLNLQSKMDENIEFDIESYLNSLSEDVEDIIITHKKIIQLPDLSRFKKLKALICSDCELTSLPELPNQLQELVCTSNKLTSLPELPRGLTILYCSCNHLTSLPNLPSELKTIYCYDNCLTSLPELPCELATLDCGKNNLSSLPNLPTELKTLWCTNNQLTHLPELPALMDLNCSENQLTSLPELPYGILKLKCYSNHLVSLPKLPDTLQNLCCQHNRLISLPELPKYIGLLNCSNNNLTSFPEVPLPDQYLSSYLFFGNNPFVEMISMNSIGPVNIRELNKRIKTLDAFRQLYYSLKFRTQLRKWLWEKIREPKIQLQYHPEYLIRNLVDEETDLNEVLERW